MSAPNKEVPVGFHVKSQQGQDLDTANACSRWQRSSEEPQCESGGGPSLRGTTRKGQPVEEGGCGRGGGSPSFMEADTRRQKGLVGRPIPTTVTGHRERNSFIVTLEEEMC